MRAETVDLIAAKSRATFPGDAVPPTSGSITRTAPPEGRAVAAVGRSHTVALLAAHPPAAQASRKSAPIDEGCARRAITPRGADVRRPGSRDARLGD